MSENQLSFDFTGKVCLVSGGGSGIGAQIGIRLAGSGAQLVLTDINEENVKKVSEECDKLSPIGVKALPIVADITQKQDIVRLVTRTVQTFHKLDVLVNCAGIVAMSFLSDPNYMSVYRRVLSTNTTSAVSLSHLSAAHLAKTNGNIVNISSIAAKRARKANPFYSMSKAAVNMLSDCSTNELGLMGVNVKCVSPGAVRTRLFEQTFPKKSLDRILEFFAQHIPAGRYGMPDDIANAVPLLSEVFQFTMGAELVVDGGGHNGNTEDILAILKS